MVVEEYREAASWLRAGLCMEFLGGGQLRWFKWLHLHPRLIRVRHDPNARV